MAVDFDVIIAGGGPVGLSLALALTRSVRGLSVAIADRRPPGVPHDRRASAIGAGVRRVFHGLGIWDELAEAAQPVTAMRISDSGTGDIARPLFLQFSGDIAPGEPFAHLVPNEVLARTLLDALGDKVEFLPPAEVAGFTAGGGEAVLELSDGSRHGAPLVVAADGANSTLRRLAGIATFDVDYRQSGLVTTISHELEHEGIAYEHFRPAGPFASLPLPGRRSSLVWTESSAEATRLATLPAAELSLAIEAAMGSVLGEVTVDDQVQVFPLRLRLARSLSGPRVAIVGDAAHVIHPIAGQGLNLGLKDVAALAESVVDAVRLGTDHGATDVLDRYARWRQWDTATMALATDGLNRLFSNDLTPMRALRDFGLSLVDRVEPLKRALIGRAAGLGGGDGPRLLAGLPI